MRYPLSRAASAATATYGVFALVMPSHLGKVLISDPRRQADLDALARVYGARDVAVGALGLLGRSERVVATSLTLCIVGDLADAVTLTARVSDARARGTVLALTLGWAAVNAGALVLDRRRGR